MLYLEMKNDAKHSATYFLSRELQGAGKKIIHKLHNNAKIFVCELT